MIDEIPEAIRESIEAERPSKTPLKAIVGSFIGLGILGLIAIFSFSFLAKEPQDVKVEVAPEIESPQLETVPEQAATPPEIPKQEEVIPKNLLGHLPYEEAPPSTLTSITADGRVRLRSAAAIKFQQMQADAKSEGVILVPVSGFRSIEAQERLFFAVKEQRVQNATKRAEVSAPPGYSEHHTGYTVDIGDGNAPATHVSSSFANTPAFRWLQANAAKYSFEMSFPPNNEQGISYEPWHWRFVGDRHSLETFYKVRN